MDYLLTYILAAMIAWCPPLNHRYSQSYKMTAEEKDTHTLQRYHDIASDIAAVTMEEEPLFKGDLGRVKSALITASIASYESGQFREDVDNVKGTGDHGQSHCIMQILMRPGEIMEDRKDCFRLGFYRIRESFRSCPQSRLEDKLAVYASGNCTQGAANSRMKMYRAKHWLDTHPFVMPESEHE
jgi:hypothetical protein